MHSQEGLGKPDGGVGDRFGTARAAAREDAATAEDRTRPFAHGTRPEAGRTAGGRARPGSVTAVLVLLALITAYQLIAGGLALAGGIAAETVDTVPPPPGIPVWAVFVAVGIALVYGVACLFLAMMVARGRPDARPAALRVNAVYGVLILALVFTPVAGVPEILASAAAFTVVALLYSRSAKAYFDRTPAAPGAAV
ncbi:hypothetical protein SUDANB121_03634 [Nocardiopsis dassonvillei]|uniref:hypothetical protein n=1 Tax=Nocardiopsis dassonvillei TaxID=2014 RepID=UPI003F5706C3